MASEPVTNTITAGAGVANVLGTLFAPKPAAQQLKGGGLGDTNIPGSSVPAVSTSVQPTAVQNLSLAQPQSAPNGMDILKLIQQLSGGQQ